MRGINSDHLHALTSKFTFLCQPCIFFLKREIRAVVHAFKTIRNVSITGHKGRLFSLFTLI